MLINLPFLFGIMLAVSTAWSSEHFKTKRIPKRYFNSVKDCDYKR